MKEFLHSNGHHLGKVYAASGLRQAQSTEDLTSLSIRGWALVSLNENRSMGKNDVSTLRFKLQGFRSPLIRIPR